MLLAAVALTAAVAATIDGEPITIATLDAPASEQVAQLHATLHEAAAAGVARLVDEALEAGSPASADPVPAVSDDDVRRFRASHPADFAGFPQAPAVEQAAIRYYLETQAGAAARAERLRRLRAGRNVVVAVPDGRTLEQPLPARRKVARVGGEVIRAAALEQVAALPLYRARGELYLTRKRRLDEMIDQRLLARAGESDAATPPTVSDDELAAFVERERQAGRAVADPERLRPYLAFQQTYRARQASLDTLRARARIEILLGAPAPPRLPDEEADAPALGPVAGPRLIVFGNYRCEACRAVQREIDRLRAGDPTLRVVFRAFVPVYDPVASEGEALVRCAATLGAFAPMRRLLLERDPPQFGRRWFDESERPALARTLDVDAAAFTACLGAAETAAAVTRDSARARALGFSEAPALLARGVPLSGMQSAETMAQALR